MITASANGPAHIPPGMVRDYDLFCDPIFDDNLHDGILKLADERRDLFWSTAHGGCWVVVGREAAFKASIDSGLFSNDPRIGRSYRGESLLAPISFDPPDHTPYRQILSRIFSPRAVKDFEPAVRDQAAALIDAVRPLGGCDFAKAVAEPLPVIFFMQLMGLPTERCEEFRQWVLDGLSCPDLAGREKIWEKVHGMTAELIRERQEVPRDDLISRLIATPIEDRALSFKELQSLCLMLLVAGLDTVTNAMATMIRHLAIDQALQVRVRADRSLVNPTVEELLRRYSNNSVPRFVARDAEFFGAPLRRGDAVLIHYPAANLDPRAVPEPAKVDVGRHASHLAFGAGVHRCVGAQLARVELQAVLNECLDRLPPFRVDPDRPWRYHTGFVFSIDVLPLLW